MGTCCTKEAIYAGGLIETDIDNDKEDVEENLSFGDCEARIRLRASSEYISMYTQQGKKGINQDAMTVWEAEHLIISNLGDSRAVLCTRGHKNQLVSVQLTLDLTPDVPSEGERIRKCEGRIFAAAEEPNVYRIWMPEENCPGLAMARAFGDFCLKDYGLISTPDISYRKLTPHDEFVVLATDGVWDALTNAEVIKIVASAKNRSNAAKLVIKRATHAWRNQYPDSKVDDCSVICLFLKEQCLSISKTKGANILNQPKLTASRNSITRLFTNDKGNADETLVSGKSFGTTHEYLTPHDGIKKVNSAVKLPRFLTSRKSF